MKPFCQCNSYRDNVEWDEEQEMTARMKTQEQLNSALSAEKQGTKLVQTHSFLSKGSSTAEKCFTQKYFLF